MLQNQNVGGKRKEQASAMSDYKHLLESQSRLSPPPRPETPNPWYHHQKRKLVLRYKKHLLEKEYARQQREQKVDSMALLVTKINTSVSGNPSKEEPN